MTIAEAIKILDNFYTCRTIDCGIEECDVCPHAYTFDELTTALDVVLNYIRDVKLDRNRRSQ